MKTTSRIFVVLSADGIGAPIAYKLQQKGKTVYYGQVSSYDKIHVKTDEDPEGKKRRLKLYDGLIKNKMDADALVKQLLTVGNPERYFIWCDFNWLWPYADKLRKAGFQGFFPTKRDSELEKDRDSAKKLVEKLYKDVVVGEHYDFKNVSEAIKFLSTASDRAFCLKGNNEDAPTIVPKNDDPVFNHMRLIDALQKFERDYNRNGLILEEKILDAHEICAQAITMNGKVIGVNCDIEVKGIGGADTGTQSGCSMDLVVQLPIKGEFYDKFLRPREHLMVRPGEMTIFDLSVYYSPSRDDFFFGEFCENRPGYNAFFTEIATHNSVADYFDKIIAEAELYDKSVKQFGASFRVFNMSDDSKFPKKKRAGSLITANPADKNCWLWDIYKDDEGKLRTVGMDDNLGCITGSGDSLEEAAKNAYAGIKKNDLLDDFSRSLADYMDESYLTSIPKRYNLMKKMGVL